MARPTLARTVAAVVVMASALVVPPAPRAAAADDAPRTFQGLTRPSRDVDLVLRVSGVLADLPVTPGQAVKEGDLIAELRSELERQSLDIARLKAESDHDIRLAETAQKLRQTELNQLEELESKEAASKWEVETTRVEVELEAVKAEAARFKKQLAELDYRREQLLLAERKLLAPFDGAILRTLKEAGEGVADLEPIAVLVRLNPIWVECHIPPDLFNQVRVGAKAVVRMNDATLASKKTRVDMLPNEAAPAFKSARQEALPDEAAVPVTREGIVVAADPLVDAASSTFRVIVEVPNGDGAIVAGALARVHFPKEH